MDDIPQTADIWKRRYEVHLGDMLRVLIYFIDTCSPASILYYHKHKIDNIILIIEFKISCQPI